MTAIILCAGFATRMYPLTENFPKPLLEVGGRPAIDHLIDQIKEFEKLYRICIVTNNRFFPDFVKWGERWHGELSEKGISLLVYNNGVNKNSDRLGAVGDLGYVIDNLPGLKGGLVAAGDNIFGFRLKPYWEKFISGDRNYVIALPADDRERLKRTGVLETDTDGKVIKFHEKPADPPANVACPALYFLQPRALGLVGEYLSSPDAADEIGYFISFLAERDEVYAIPATGEAMDIGTMESYEKARETLRGNG